VIVDSIPCPWYKTVPLSLALSPRIFKEVKNFKPDIIHASSPGIMVRLSFNLHLSSFTYSLSILVSY
jgi:sulfoquinovosyltransferase